MFTEDDLLPISALQHLMFCERQWALIHLEGVWVENRLTAEGRILHEKAHDQEAEVRDDLRIVRGLRLRSLSLGLIGQADVVEFHPDANGVEIKNIKGHWRPFPVEYKRGKPKPDECDLVQICAQAMCLEEMLSVVIDRGAIFYGQPRRRMDVEFTSELRSTVVSTALRLHNFTHAAQTPPPSFSDKCKNCSLVDICLPKTVKRKQSVGEYLLSEIESIGNQEEKSE